MSTLDRPRLRPLTGRQVQFEGQSFVILDDPLGCFLEPYPLLLAEFQGVVRYFDGHSTLVEIARRIERERGESPSISELQDWVETLDRALVLDGPCFAAFRQNYAALPIRPAACAGRSYPADAGSLRADLGRMFHHPAGSGPPTARAKGAEATLRAVLCPHIDFGRGGPVYTWAYRELVERSDADIFVILGVAHQPCRHRFALTRKDFATPLGIARTDRDFVDRVAAVAGTHLFEDELAHRSEHSVEFQAVFLRYLLGDDRPFTIVPILVGSFHDLMTRRIDPITDPDVSRLVDGLRRAEAASGKKVAYIGGIDLCHVGPEFGDPLPVDDATLGGIKAFDLALLDRAEANDPAGWFRQAAEVNNHWRVCGLAATYTLLHAIGPATTGRILRYDQAINPARTCCVSFASVAFDQAAVKFSLGRF